MANNLDQGITDLTRVIGELARDVHRLGDRTGTGGSQRTTSTDYARSYRKTMNMPQFSTNPDSFTSQLATDSGRLFNKMTLGFLPLMKKNFLTPLKDLWGDKNKGFLSKLLGSFGTMIKGVFSLMNDLAGRVYSMIKSVLSYGYQEFLKMQSAVGLLAANIGLSRSESKGLLLNMTEMTVAAMEYGGSMSDISEIIGTISDVTGKNRLIDVEDVKNIERLGLGTSLGFVGLAKLAAEFSNLGISMDKTFKLVDKARDGAAKLGLNVGKVLTTYTTLVNGLTGFQMKSGLDNMVKLATQATQLRMDLSGVAESMSAAFFEPEGAVEAAAKMQVLGGQFAEKFGDAFELMYKAQVSPEMFQKDLMDMVKGLAVKGENGIFYVPPQQMRMIQEASKALGVNSKELINGAIEQGKLIDKYNLLGEKGIFFRNEEDKMAIANLIDFSEEKGGYIIRMPDGDKKLLSDLTNQSQFQNILNQKKADDDAAKKRMNFSERLSNVFNRFYMSFSQVFAEIFDRLDNSGFMNQLDEFMTSLSNQIIPAIKNLFSDKGKLKDILDDVFGKIKTIVGVLTDIWNGKAEFWDKIKDSAVTVIKGIWDLVLPYLELALGKLIKVIGEVSGFDSVTRMGEKLIIDASSRNKMISEKIVGNDEQKKYLSDIKEHKGDLSIGQTVDMFGAAGKGALAGAALGSIIPGLGTVVGGIVGALVGGVSSHYLSRTANEEKVDDAIVTSNGRVLKGAKGDIPALFDEAGLRNNMSNSGSSEIKHSGTITVKSEDGKQITISDLDKIGRYTLAQYMDSINHGLKNGTAVYNNEKMPITPIGA
jgi:hypothetical protein